MKKKDFVFTLGLCMLMGIIWAVGEIVMGLWVAVIPSAHIFWIVGIVVFTLGVSIWHTMKNDESDCSNPKKAKYIRKVNKRNNKKNKKQR